MAADIRIATASPADAAAVAAIYAHHVIHGTASFDTRPPGADETAALIERVLAAGWPFLVAREPRDPGDPGDPGEPGEPGDPAADPIADDRRR